MSMNKRTRTKNLNIRHTAWFQLVSAAGAFLDHYKGQVSDQTIEDVKALHRCVERVLELEGLRPVSDSTFS